MYKINIKKQADKTFEKMPVHIQEKFRTLVADLKDKGPIRTEWSNYSTLGKNEHHCHLSRKWVACWRNEKNSIIIEVYYAGSREDAPY